LVCGVISNGRQCFDHWGLGHRPRGRSRGRWVGGGGVRQCLCLELRRLHGLVHGIRERHVGWNGGTVILF
jgi:hypothetical protein